MGSDSLPSTPHLVLVTCSRKKSVDKMVMLGKLPVMWACSWCEELTETSQTSHLISPVASPLNSAPWEIEFRKKGRDKVLLESTEMGLG